MKKILSLFICLFSFVVLVGCTNGTDKGAKAVELSSKEKFELIQGMDAVELKTLQMALEVKGSAMIDGFSVEVDGKINTYFDLTNRLNVFNYTTLDVSVLTPEFDIDAKGSLYANLNGAYLDLQGEYTLGGTKLSVSGKEKMDLTEFTGGEIPVEVYNELLNLIPWDEIKNVEYDEIDDEAIKELLTFINVYKDKDKTTFKILINKAKIAQIAQKEGSQVEISSFLGSISDNSKIELAFEFNGKKLVKLSLETVIVIKFELHEDEIDAQAKFSILLNAKAPTLPTSAELETYREVEMFTVLAPFFLGMEGSTQPSLTE